MCLLWTKQGFAYSNVSTHEETESQISNYDGPRTERPEA